MRAILLPAACAMLAATAAADVQNGSFETGDFTNWIVEDSPAPFVPMQVSTGLPDVGHNLFVHEVTDGTYGFVMGFESSHAPVTMRLRQDITINPARTRLVFDYRAGWDMFNYPNSSIDRTFKVKLRPSGGGPVIESWEILRARQQSLNWDTGDLVGDVDMSSYAGQSLQLTFEWRIPQADTGPGLFQVDAIRFEGPPPGSNYCMAENNSTGVPAVISASGTNVVANNDLVLECDHMPQNSFSFFLTSMDQGFQQNPGGSAGNLCLSGAIGRYVGPGQVQNSGTAGAVSLAVDLTNHPTPTGLVAVVPGETWNFTCWFRDTDGMGNATSNFSDGYEITFQ